MIGTNKGHRILVLGAGYAGMMATLRMSGRLAGRTGRQGAELTLVNASDRFVERIRMHQRAAGQSLRDVAIPEMLKGTGVKFVEGWVNALDPDRREVQVRTDEGDRSLHYDTLVDALGSATDTGAVPGAAEYAHTLNGPAAADRLFSALCAAPVGARLVVCGGGFTGVEAATELAETFRGLRVSVVTAGEIGSGLSARGRKHVLKALSRHEIELTEHSLIHAVRAGTLEVQGKAQVPFDICLWAGSFAPSPLACVAGLEVNNRGQAVVDPFLRSRSHPEIFVVGDAAHPAVEPRGPIRMAAGTALPMGAHAADTIAAMLAGEELRPFRFAYAGLGLSLGRTDGLGQLLHGDDTPRDLIVKGRPGGLIREGFVRYVLFALTLERRRPGFFRWPHGKALLQQNQHEASRSIFSSAG